jgi:hypothetical protein
VSFQREVTVIPRRADGGSLDVEKLVQVLRELKAQVPAVTAARLGVEDDLRHEELTGVMDACVAAGLPFIEFENVLVFTEAPCVCLFAAGCTRGRRAWSARTGSEASHLGLPKKGSHASR